MQPFGISDATSPLASQYQTPVCFESMKYNPNPLKMAVDPHIETPAKPSLEDTAAQRLDAGDTPLELTRQRLFRTTKRSTVGEKSEIDEAAIALVELSVLVYGDLDQIAAAASNFCAPEFAVFSKSGSGPASVPAKQSDPQLIESIRKFRESVLNAQMMPSAEAAPQREAPPISSPEDILSNSILRARAHERESSVPPAALRPIPLAADGKPLFNVAANSTPDNIIAAHGMINGKPHALAIMHGDAALISFRGTVGLADWGLDASFWPTLTLRFRHWGFEFRWQRLRSQIETWLDTQTRRLGRRPTLYLGGHSLGGAVATLAAADLAPQYDIARVVTIGSPRTGGPFFVSRYSWLPAAPHATGAQRTLADVTTRFVHGRDGITFIPPWPIYSHVGKATYLIHGDRIPIDDFASYQSTTAVSGIPFDPSNVWQLKNAILGDNWRFGLQRLALYASLALPSSTGARLLSYLTPIFGEVVVRSFLHHKSARYLDFFPRTEIGRAMSRWSPLVGADAEVDQ
jgi:Lipase (class 3)